MIKLDIEAWECTTCGSTTFCPHCKGEKQEDSIKRHLVTRVERALEEEIYYSIKFALKDAIEEIFRDHHVKYNTKSGDITPTQAIDLEKSTMDLAALIKEQVKQNL